MRPLSILLLTLASATYSYVLAEEPALPFGLDNSSPLHSAKNTKERKGSKTEEPALPSDLFVVQDNSTRHDENTSLNWRDSLPFEISGFTEARLGTRQHRDTVQKQTSVSEVRLHLETVKSWQTVVANLTADLLYDPVLDQHKVDLDSGQGWLDIREANVVFHPAENVDLKLGRQIITWGTGDMIFINDLFPKDWNSFFIGRDQEYLKAPSDIIKVAVFHKLANLDIVYTPQFDADRFIDGARISYFNQATGEIAGRDAPIQIIERGNTFSEDEVALRFNRMFSAYETAMYFYDGYWKSPNGQSPLTGLFIFPTLTVYGASMRGPALGGIINLEAGYYDSRDDSDGSDPFIRNSEWRFIAGYERELVSEFTGALQYYLEYIDNHHAYIKSLPADVPVRDKERHVVTFRLTKLMMNQNLTLSLFSYYSPSDKDGYLRPNIHFQMGDDWSLEAGGNFFYGHQNETFFGQFEDNSNLYLSTRFGF